MKRFIIVFLMLLQLVIVVYSQRVEKSLALEKVINMLVDDTDNPSKIVRQRKVASLTASSLIEEISLTYTAGLYKVHVNNHTVFMTTDMRMPAVIAQVEGNVNSMNDLPPAFLEYLATYEEATSQLSSSMPVNNEWILTASPHKVKKDTIGPLMTRNGIEVNWDQNGNNGGALNSEKVYNKFCPYVNKPSINNHALVGCVAVAMAQVMWYWQWPPMYCIDNKSHLYVYDYNKMPTEIYGDYRTSIEEVDQIASLLYHCGSSVRMRYGSDGSSAYLEDAMYSMALYNEYASCIDYTLGYYNWSSFQDAFKFHVLDKCEQRLVDNIRNGQPVIARGQKSKKGDGHAFVIDGWTVTDKVDWFHVNWGWGMQRYNSDKFETWCRIRGLTPMAGVSYNYWKAFIFDIIPAYLTI